MTRKIKPPTDEQQLKRIAKRLRDPSISHADYAKLELARMRLVRRIEKRAATRNAEPVPEPSNSVNAMVQQLEAASKAHPAVEEPTATTSTPPLPEASATPAPSLSNPAPPVTKPASPAASPAVNDPILKMLRGIASTPSTHPKHFGPLPGNPRADFDNNEQAEAEQRRRLDPMARGLSPEERLRREKLAEAGWPDEV